MYQNFTGPYGGQPVQQYNQQGPPIWDTNALTLYREILREQRQLMKEENRDREEYHKAEAFSEIKSNSGQMYIQNKRGISHCLMDADIHEVVHVVPDPLYRMPPCYFVFFKGISDPIIISEKDLESSTRLITLIVETTKKTVKPIPTEKRAAELIRQRILALAQRFTYGFYGGWRKDKSEWRFDLLSGVTTHGQRMVQSFKHEEEVTQMPTASGGLAAANQVVRLLSTIGNPNLRRIMTILVHTAVLSTVLNDGGYRLSMGLCFFCADPRVQRHLEIILSWFGDSTIMLAAPASRFLDSIVERKDQPAVFRSSSASSGNGELLKTILTTGEVPIDKQGKLKVDFNSCPVLLSSEVNALQTSGAFAVLDVSGTDIKQCTEEVLKSLCKYMPDYLMGFTSFVSSRIDLLLSYVSQGIDEMACSVEGVNQEGMTLLGVFKGVCHIMDEYYHALAPGSKMAAWIRSIEVPDVLIAAVEDSSGMGLYSDDLAQNFLTAMNEMVERGNFDIRQIPYEGDLNEPCRENLLGIVYADLDYISFSRAAFRAVCLACDTSVPVMVRALRESDMLRGTAVNSETSMTRITVRHVNGGSKREYVYKFDRSVLE